MTALWIRNGLVGSKDGFHRADLVVNGERFEALGAVRPFGPWSDMDATGLWLVPGGLGEGGGFELLLLLDRVARGQLEPGQLVGMRGGEILPGLDANLVAVDPAATTELGPQLPSGDTNPHEGRTVRGAIRWVMQRGVLTGGDGSEPGI